MTYVLTQIKRSRAGAITVQAYRFADNTNFIFQQGEYVADVLLRPYLRLFRHIGMFGEWVIDKSHVLFIDQKHYDLNDPQQVLQLYEDYPEERDIA